MELHRQGRKGNNKRSSTQPPAASQADTITQQSAAAAVAVDASGLIDFVQLVMSQGMLATVDFATHLVHISH